MAHYAFLDENNVVVEVITGVDENQILDGKTPEQWYSDYRGLKCIRTSYNNNIRRRYAGKGFTYDPTNDVFLEPQPFASWSLNDNFDWTPPKPKPSEGFTYWDEDKKDWVSVES